MLLRVAAGLAGAALGLGSVLLAAMALTTVPAVAPSGAAPSVTAAVAVDAPIEPTASISPSPVPATLSPEPSPAPSPSTSPTPPRTPSVRESFVAQGTEPGLAADPFHPGVVAVVTQNVVMHDPTNG
jgi:hypothetical protein